MIASTSEDLIVALEEHGPVFGHYVYMAQVLSDMFAPVLETVVHDLQNPEESIIAIFNGHLTGRKVGDPATDLGRQLKEGEFPDLVVGYENMSPNGQKLKSSSVAIRNENGDLLGVMGLNFDVSYFEQFGKFVEQFISGHRNEHVLQAEHFHSMAPQQVNTPHEDIKEAIDQYLIAKNWNTRILSNVEKRELVELLYQNGYFKNRSAVTIIANELGLTRTSVYNYKNDYMERIDGEA